MKITGVETILLSRAHEPERQWFTARYRSVKADCAIVAIHTDEGLCGIGEACAYGGLPDIQQVVDWLRPEIVGRGVDDWRIVPHPNGRSIAYDCAVAGIDSALWDLRGQTANKRVSELLAPQPLDRVRLYASSGVRFDWRDRPEDLIDEVLGYVADGYTGCKVRIGTEWSWDGITTDHYIGLLRELAAAVNGRMELMVDGNQRLTVDQALAIGRELGRLGFVWFEEPIPQTDIDGYVTLSKALDIPISGGEQFTTLEQFRPYIERRAYSIVQPDAGCCGISEGLRIAEMAARYGIDCCPHSWHNGLMAMANAHLIAALPNPRVLEVCMVQGPLQWAILAEPPRIDDGWLVLPERPGLGVTLADDLSTQFPFIEGHYGIEVSR